MNLGDMLTILASRLEDQNNKTFSTDNLKEAINYAQDACMNQLPYIYFEKELLALSPQVFSSQKVSLPADLFGDMVLGIQNATTDKWYRIVSPSDAERLSNPLIAPDADFPAGYIEGDDFVSLVDSDTAGVRIKYIQKPTDASTIALDASIDLNISLHELVLNIAESKLFLQDDEPERAIAAMNLANGIVESLLKKAGTTSLPFRGFGPVTQKG